MSIDICPNLFQNVSFIQIYMITEAIDTNATLYLQYNRLITFLRHGIAY